MTAGAYIRNPVDQWVREKSAASLFYGGTDSIHNKLRVKRKMQFKNMFVPDP